MNKDEIMAKIKELLSDGNLDKAKAFLEEHKADLGDYYEKAQTLLKDHADDVGGLLDKAKSLFDKTK